jgi:aminoglycoside phosphotransferase (APT) family kinase protein
MKLGPLLGAGKVAEVYAHGDRVLKLYRPGEPKSSAFREAAILSLVEQGGVIAPRVEEVAEFDGRWGLVMSRVNGVPFAPALVMSPPSKPHLEALARLQISVHRAPASQLPGLKARVAANIGRTPLLDAAHKARLLAELAALPDGDRLCHGDFHPWNVLGTPEDAAIVDWLDASCGAPAADVCRSYVLIAHVSEPLARAYVEIYAGLAGMDLDEVWRWRAVVAGARLAEGVPDEEASLKAMAGAI